MKEPKIIFFGTPELAATVLKRVASNYQIILVITEPDAPAGRGQKLTPPPVKIAAQKLGLAIAQPTKKEQILPLIKKYRPDLGILVAYGQIIPESVLQAIPLGILNLHPSLLPKYRGPAPVVHAILSGDKTTGISLMRLDAGVDTGPLLAQKKVVLAQSDNTSTLNEKLIKIGADLLIKTLPAYLTGKIKPQPQKGTPSFAPKINKGMGRIDWSQSPIHILHQIQAFNPWPHAYTNWQDKQLIIHAAQIKNRRLVPTIVQLAGRRQTSWKDFLNGQHLTSEEALAKIVDQNSHS